MAGHLFVCKADLTKVACDAWLLPTNAEKKIEPYWHCEILDDLGLSNGDFSRLDVPDAFGGAELTAKVTATDKAAPYPLPILTVVRKRKGCEIDDILTAATAFVQAYVRGSPRFLSSRHRPLLAMPLIGTGKSGSAELISEIIRALLKHCTHLAERFDVDIALVFNNDLAYSVAQIDRKRLGAELNTWAKLTDEQMKAGDRIAKKGRDGNLVLFIGAGVSAGAGLPSWGQLIGHLADDVGFHPDKLEALQGFNFLDQAEILDREYMRKGKSFSQAIVSILGQRQTYSLAHALISDWTANEAVTQNYDTMYETACRDSLQPLSVIPYSFDETSAKWLLKMHGCVTQPEDIVLSRSDYLDYDYSRSALSGIVQALLVTKHMLFLGFSLTDDHFVQLIFGVRKALEGMVHSADGHSFGTVMTPLKSGFQQELWSNELSFISASEEHGDIGAAINIHDIILDYITCQMHSSDSYLFKEEFADILTHDEEVLKERLLNVAEALKTEARSEATEHFFDYLDTLGYSDTSAS